MEHEYNVSLGWKHDRIGLLSSPELNTFFEVATPPQFENGVEGIWSPEHLFTASVSSCFMTTFLAIAANSKLEFSAFSCMAQGILGQVDGKFQVTEVKLFPQLVILKEEDRERADRILQKSEKACLISNSVKSSISLSPQIAVMKIANI